MTNVKNSKRVFFLFSLLVIPILFSSSARAESKSISTDASKGVVVVEASGLLDPVMVRMMEETLTEVDSEATVALVFQINISGSVVENDKIISLGKCIFEKSDISNDAQREDLSDHLWELSNLLIDKIIK